MGAEAFLQQTGHAYEDPAAPTSLTTLSRYGLSFWGWYFVTEELGAVARLDYFDPKSGANASEQGDSRTYLLAGMVYRPVKSVNIMPNIQVETYEQLPDGRTIDTAVTARLTCAFAF